MNPTVHINKLERVLQTGEVESLDFMSGVNIIEGIKNTGKTVWLQMFDYIMGNDDSVENAFSDNDDTLPKKYIAIHASLTINNEPFELSRRWDKQGIKTKISVNNQFYDLKEFQHIILEQLKYPLIKYPKGDPYSDQTWPELSWRDLLRHIYRRQHFWNDIADRQQSRTQFLCLSQFAGNVESIYTDKFSDLVAKRKILERQKAQKEEYKATLDEISKEIFDNSQFSVTPTEDAIDRAVAKLGESITELQNKKESLLSEGPEKSISEESKLDAVTLLELESKRDRMNGELHDIRDRQTKLINYTSNIAQEASRLNRADSAYKLLSPIAITNCPACDKKIQTKTTNSGNCYLCGLPTTDDEIVTNTQANNRLSYERSHLIAEEKEAQELSKQLDDEMTSITNSIKTMDDEIDWLKTKLNRISEVISPIVSREISAIDMDIGRMVERQDQLRKLKRALKRKKDLTNEVNKLNSKVMELESQVESEEGLSDSSSFEEDLSEAMNDYLNQMVVLIPNSWGLGDVNMSLSRSGFVFKVGQKRWDNALGGTARLYFLIAYHYGLLKVSINKGIRYPGLVILDFPPDLMGDAITDEENFILSPFVDLLARDKYCHLQMIVAGASFKGLDVAKRHSFKKQWVGTQ